jgi:type IV secretory pathway VirJ component
MREARLLAQLTLAATLAATAVSGAAETLDSPVFFKVWLHRTAATPPHVVLFVSGDPGWIGGVTDMAALMAGMDTLVVGVDIRYYLRYLRNAPGACSDAASDFAALAQLVEKELGYKRKVTPWLAGYSSGATLAYAVLAQAPPGTFQGALSFGFCPDLELVKPLCRGNGLELDPAPDEGRGFVFRPSPAVMQPWVVFQGDVDHMCPPEATKAFASRTGHSEVVDIPNASHGFALLKEWQGEFATVYRRLLAAESRPPTQP